MKSFLSCDWGTSNFRLRLIGAESLTVIEERNTGQGIGEVYEEWKQTGKQEEKRFCFYFAIIEKSIKEIEDRIGETLHDVPLIISGMASSTIGMVDLPYKMLPFSTSGEDLERSVIKAGGDLRQNVIIISGARTENDVMRGEETKLIGCAATCADANSHIYILPGTHPKHIYVQNDQVTAFETYMTGEFFEFLATKSILSVSVKKGGNFESEGNLKSFTEGVIESNKSNLLHESFLVRTNQLFKKFTEEENYFYLSGLLIGTELSSLLNKNVSITIVSGKALCLQYHAALEILKLPTRNATITTMDADEALIRGQWEICKKVKIT